MRPEYRSEVVHTDASGLMYVACRLAEKYRNRLPSPQELMRELGMSRATAYRWLRAIRDARGLP